jgi:tRNA(adenine34) deaminase
LVFSVFCSYRLGGAVTGGSPAKAALNRNTQLLRHCFQLLPQNMYDDAYFMGLALEQARAAALADEVPVGAVVVKDGQVIAAGRNAPIALHDPSAHAEMQALRAAAHTLGNYRLDGCELYVTLEPCAMCAGAMLHARLKRVVFGANEPKTGAAGSVVNLFENTQLNHQTSVLGGVLTAQCGEVLQDFFRDKRLFALGSGLNTPLREDALRTPEGCFSELTEFPWRGHFVNNLPVLEGLRMHYLDEGPVQSPQAFLCLHGRADWSYVFRHMLPVWCAAGHRVVVPDFIGYGKSDKSKRTTAHALAFHQQCLGEFVERLDLRNMVLVVQAGSLALGMVDGLLVSGRVKAVVRMHMQASAQDVLAYECPYPDAGHKAALRAFPPNTKGGETGLVAQEQALVGESLVLHDVGEVVSQDAAQSAQAVLALFAAG